MKNVSSILVVDDDQDIGTMLKMMLEYKGYAVTVINRADQTHEILSSNKIDLVILDMLIADIYGTDVCMQIRKNIATAYLPVLMISALPDARQDCIMAGANDFISKPFDMQEILSKVRANIAADKNSL